MELASSQENMSHRTIDANIRHFCGLLLLIDCWLSLIELPSFANLIGIEALLLVELFAALYLIIISLREVYTFNRKKFLIFCFFWISILSIGVILGNIRAIEIRRNSVEVINSVLAGDAHSLVVEIKSDSNTNNYWIVRGACVILNNEKIPLKGFIYHINCKNVPSQVIMRTYSRYGKVYSIWMYLSDVPMQGVVE
jgi:hypothetical protein